jgi:type III pantothenate kinase
MLLVLDVGNTQTSFGVFKAGKLVQHWRAETQISKTVDEYASFLFPLMNHAGLDPLGCEGIAICSVVPPVEETFTRFCRHYLKQEPFRLSANSKLGFILRVDTPGEVGADRLANTAYAVQKLSLPAIVVDLGTATTFDVITQDKVYQGGIILPGVRMGAESLSSKTSLLPLIDVKFPPSVIGKNTTTCIQSGVLFGYCDAIDGLLDRLQKELNSHCDIALTGGLSSLFHSKLRAKTKLLPDLTLEGTAMLYQLNRA